MSLSLGVVHIVDQLNMLTGYSDEVVILTWKYQGCRSIVYNKGYDMFSPGYFSNKCDFQRS